MALLQNITAPHPSFPNSKYIRYWTPVPFPCSHGKKRCCNLLKEQLSRVISGSILKMTETLFACFYRPLLKKEEKNS